MLFTHYGTNKREARHGVAASRDMYSLDGIQDDDENSDHYNNLRVIVPVFFQPKPPNDNDYITAISTKFRYMLSS